MFAPLQLLDKAPGSWLHSGQALAATAIGEVKPVKHFSLSVSPPLSMLLPFKQTNI